MNPKEYDLHQARKECNRVLAQKDYTYSIIKDQIYWDLVEICAGNNSTNEDVSILAQYIHEMNKGIG